MENDQVIAKVICFFNSDGADSQVTALISSGQRPKDIPYSTLDTTVEVLGAKELSGTDDYWYVFLVLVWPYLVSIFLNATCILLVTYKLCHTNVTKRRDTLVTACLQRLDSYLHQLGLEETKKIPFNHHLLSTCLFSISLNSLDFVYLVFGHRFHSVLCLAGLTVSVSTTMLLLISLLFLCFVLNDSKLWVYCNCSWYLVTVAFLLFNTVYLQYQWIYPVIYATTILLFFGQYMLFLLKPCEKVYLNELAVKFISFNAILGMTGLSVVIPSRLFWQTEFGLVFFVTESLGRLIFTTGLSLYFLYSVFSHHEDRHMFHRRVVPVEEKKRRESIESVDKKDHVFEGMKH